jgi:hypothetical protein
VEKKQAKHGLAMKKLANAGLTQSIYFQELSAFLRATVRMFFIHIGRRLIKNELCTMYFPLKYLETKVALFFKTLRSNLG